MQVDPSRMIAQIDAKMAKLTSPRQRSMLANFREHVVAEVHGGNTDVIMATQVENPQYQFWGMGYGDFGPKGHDAVAAHYQSMFDRRINKLEHNLERIIIDDNHIVLDGDLHMQWPGKELIAVGVEVDDPNADYVYTYRSWTIFHYDDEGNCTGESSFSDGMPNLARVKKLTTQGELAED